MRDVPWYQAHLICSDCGHRLQIEGAEARCTGGCDPRPLGSPPDLRPRGPIRRTIQHSLEVRPAEILDRLSLEPPKSTYAGPRPIRDSDELFSAAAPSLPSGAALLDLGCGPRDQEVVASHLGLRYVGIDYDSPAADLLADAHSIPFESGLLDAILAYAVLEHLQDPLIALGEVSRVLVPGGVFFGTVSQGEPFHASFFHMTAWGLLAALMQAGLVVEMIWPARDTLGALSEMGRYPLPIKAGLSALDLVHRRLPILSPRKALRWSRREKRIDQLHRAGSIGFLARRPATESVESQSLAAVGGR